GRGLRVIQQVIGSGSSGSATARLINAILGIADPDKRRLIRVVIGHLVRAGLLRQSLENSFDHLVRGLEALTKFHGLSSQSLLHGVPTVEQATVRSHLEAAQTAIQAFMTRAAEHGLCVTKPWGETARDDFAVEHEGHFV